MSDRNIPAETVSWWRRLFGLGPKLPHAHDWIRNMAWRYGALKWECECGATRWYTHDRGEQVEEPGK